MKVVVIAIDGLEYNLVEKWNIEIFKQKYYGKHDVTVAVKKGEPIYTPLIWASFLLGRPSYMLGYSQNILEIHKSKLAYKGPLKYLFIFKYKLLGHRKLGIRKIMTKIGLYDIEKIRTKMEKIESMPENILYKTFIYEAIKKGYKVKYNSIPSMPNDKYAEYRAFLYKYFDSDLKQRISILNKLYLQTEQDLKNILIDIEKYNLIIYYTPLLDEAHHMLYRPNKRIPMLHLRKYYKYVENQVKKIINKIDYNNSLVLIVSDHGYDPSIHEHSTYGFWSSNVELNPIPRKITDFRAIIEKHLYSQ